MVNRFRGLNGAGLDLRDLPAGLPTLVGDASSPMIGRVISDEFGSARDWPMASSVAVVLLLIMVGPTMLYNHFSARAEGEGKP